MPTTRSMIWLIAIVLLAVSYLWMNNYYALLEDYKHLQRLFYLQKDNDPGISIPIPFRRPQHGYLDFAGWRGFSL